MKPSKIIIYLMTIYIGLLVHQSGFGPFDIESWLLLTATVVGLNLIQYFARKGK